jgi:phosphomethylpyrimidine synthase
MRITEDVRKFAAEQGITEEVALEARLQEKAEEFVKKARKFTQRHSKTFSCDCFPSSL